MLCGILLLGLSGCRSGESRHFPIETPYVSIDADTLGVDIEGDLGGFVFHRDRYYAFFHQWYEQDGGLHMDSHLYVLTKEGQILHEITLAEQYGTSDELLDVSQGRQPMCCAGQGTF